MGLDQLTVCTKSDVISGRRLEGRYAETDLFMRSAGEWSNEGPAVVDWRLIRASSAAVY